MSKKDSEEAEKPPADTKKDAEPELPYKEGTDKYAVAKALIAGETDRNKIVRELGVGINTVYNVTTELIANGYVLAIHQKRRIPLPPFLSSSSSLSTQTTRTTQTTPKTLSDLSPEQINALVKLAGVASGESGEEKVSEKTSLGGSTQNPPSGHMRA